MADLTAEPSFEEVTELLLLQKWLQPGRCKVTLPASGQPVRFLVDSDEVSTVIEASMTSSSVLSTPMLQLQFLDVHGVRVVEVSQPGDTPRDVELLVVGQIGMTSSTPAAFIGYWSAIR